MSGSEYALDRREALADGRVDARERSAILGEVATLESACVGIRASVSGGDL